MLATLILRNNQLTSVPAALRNSKSLRGVDLRSNNITAIPANAFGNNPSLLEIYLDYLSQLNVVNDCAFCGLKNLQV
jgi:Leucine-rich repeat (LRR) protein